MPFYFEDFVVELLSEIYQAVPQKVLKPEIDGVLVRGKKPIVAIEVKMSNIENHDLYRFIQKTASFKCRKIIVGLKDETTIKHKEIEVLTPQKLYNLLKLSPSSKHNKNHLNSKQR
ncbi:MAG: hypothetical protein B6U94_08330 [Thermofilum sp. ex4484_79]|nr:MAG: hypothetical protein B6U94_08330 [Thermofilum sp. ex4484_79]